MPQAAATPRPGLQGTVYNTVHKWTHADGWVALDTRGVPPAPRWTHTAVEYQGGMYVFGGFYGFGGQGPTVRDTSAWLLRAIS